MKKLIVQTLSLTTLITLATAYTGITQAHTGGATLGASGDNQSATALAAVTCFDDGNGSADHIIVDIEDTSDPDPESISLDDVNRISLQVYKGIQATNTTDTIPGDGNPSEEVTLVGGAGVYWLLVNKTNDGPRKFSATWHCNTSDGTHTGTEISVRQFQ